MFPHSPKDVHRTEGAYPDGFLGSAYPWCSSLQALRSRWSKAHRGTQPTDRRALRELAGPAISAPGRSPPHDRAAARAGPGTTRQNARAAAGLPHALSTEVSQSLVPHRCNFPGHSFCLRVPDSGRRATVTLSIEEESLPPLRIVGHVPARGKEMWHGHCQLP